MSVLGLNSGPQAGKQTPLSAETSHQPKKFFYVQKLCDVMAGAIKIVYLY